MKVRFQNRTRCEGLEPHYTKPHAKRNARNLGGALQVCAGIRKDKVVLWEYIEGKWDGAAAAHLYTNHIAKTLRRLSPGQDTYLVMEDNGPTGYKSSVALRAKESLGINTMDLPRYSPDLNPHDFFLWDHIEKRMAVNAPKNARETVDAYKKRLRQTAMSTPRNFLARVVSNIKKRANAIYHSNGENIKID